MTTQFVYFPGLNSKPDENNPKIKMLKSLKNSSVIIIDTKGKYSPNDYFWAYDEIREKITNYHDDVVLVGTSLGGFWAREFAILDGYSWIAINPVVTKMKEPVRIEGFDNESYWDVYSTKRKGNSPGLLIIAEDDDVIPFKDTYDFFSGSCMIATIKRGGHQMKNTTDYSGVVKTFLQLNFHDAGD